MAIDGSLWRELKGERSFVERNKLADVLARACARDEIEELVGLCESTSLDDVDGALRVLARLSPEGAELLGRLGGDALIARLQQVIRDHYPDVPGGVALNVLRTVDRAAALSSLVRDVDLKKAVERGFLSYLGDLTSFSSSPDAVARLREVEGLGGSAGREARAHLDGIEPKDAKKLEDLARAWRETRAPAALANVWMYHQAGIEFGKTSAKQVKRLLGRPDLEDSGMLAYLPSGGTALTLQKDEEGHIVAAHLT
jgi:hypothetical protein